MIILSRTAKRKMLVPFFLLLLAPCHLTGQAGYPYYFRVYFTDKGVNNTGPINLQDLVSQRAIERRQKAGVPFPVMSDLPVWKEYLDAIISRGYLLHCSSKWMNTALFRSQTSDAGQISQLPFVKEVKLVRSPSKKAGTYNKLDFETILAPQQSFDRPITMVNGQVLHGSGFTGRGIIVAVLDGGFTNADKVTSLEDLRRRRGIISTHDFVNKGPFVYSDHVHGTAVLSILAGNIPGLIAGTAPSAEYILLKTEDSYSEFPCEEDYWAAGAEYADSAGADIISSSLGYFTFDNPAMNYSPGDLDGNTAFVTRAADMAASKGILVVNSAGNERNGTWKKIIFPSDGDSVLAAGAVDYRNEISSFSSAGPSADRRIKPDNSAMGVAVPVNTSGNIVVRSNGTSFSCPVLSGMAACLMQAVKEATADDVIVSFHESADRYNAPDSLYGYGIPDMSKALTLLQDKYTIVPANDITAFPNPSSGEFRIIFKQPPGSVSMEIISLSGMIIARRDIPGFAGREIRVTELETREQGVYIIRIRKDDGYLVKKIIRIR